MLYSIAKLAVPTLIKKATKKFTNRKNHQKSLEEKTKEKKIDPNENLCITNYDENYYSGVAKFVKNLLTEHVFDHIDAEEMKKFPTKDSQNKDYSAIVVANHFSRQDFMYPILQSYLNGVRPFCIAAGYDVMQGMFAKVMRLCRAFPVPRGNEPRKEKFEKFIKLKKNLEDMIKSFENIWQFGWKGRNYTAEEMPLETGLIDLEIKIAQEGHKIQMYPVWIGYSRIIEDEIFEALQKGHCKGNVVKTEVADAEILKKKIFYQKNVQMYVHVGDPIDVNEFCREYAAAAEQRKISAVERKAAAKALELTQSDNQDISEKIPPEKQKIPTAGEELCRKIKAAWEDLYMPMPIEIFCYAVKQAAIKKYGQFNSEGKTEMILDKNEIFMQIWDAKEKILSNRNSKNKYLKNIDMDPSTLIDEAMPHLYSNTSMLKRLFPTLIDRIITWPLKTFAKKDSSRKTLKYGPKLNEAERDIIRPEGSSYVVNNKFVVDFYANMIKNYVEWDKTKDKIRE